MHHHLSRVTTPAPVVHTISSTSVSVPWIGPARDVNDVSIPVIYTVSQKTVQKCFCHKFVKCLPTLIIFGTQIAQRICLCEVQSFSTLPN